MELSAPTMTSVSPNNNTASQQGSNNIGLNTDINNSGSTDTRPSNGNDSLQSQMQKPNSLNNSIVETTTTNPVMKDESTHKQDATPLSNNGNVSNDDISSINLDDISIMTTNDQGDFQEKQIEAIVSGDSMTFTSYNKSDVQADVTLVIDTLLDLVEAEIMHTTNAASSQSSSLYVNESSLDGFTSVVTPVADEDDDLNKPKDIVTLRNLELTPPPQTPDVIPKRSSKRSRSTSTEPREEPMTEGRSKRQRKQTQLFQVGESAQKESRKGNRISTNFISTPQPKAAPRSIKKTARSQASTRKKSKSPSPLPQPPVQQQISQLPPDVIFYEKHDYLAIRNEANTFYLCQLTENVRVHKKSIKVKWLDTNDDGETYFMTSHYDQIPHNSIIMPVMLNKLKGTKRGKQMFSLDDQVKDSIMERLKRSLNFPAQNEQ